MGAKLILFLALAWAGTAQGLEVGFEAAVDRIRVGNSQPVMLTLTITTDESVAHMPAPRIALDDFVVEGPVPSTRHSVSIVNSEVQESHVRELRYTLFPRRLGKLTIGSASLRLGGETYRTNPIDLEVVASGGAQGRPAQASGNVENVFVQVSADRNRAYVGQQVTVDYDLFYKVRIYDVGFTQIPSFSGFWSKEVFVAHQLKAHQTTFQGIRYNVAPLRRMALFPTSAGTISVDPLVISFEVPVRRGGRGLLDVFGASMKALAAASDGIEIEVLPLPQAGQPVDFAGAVGRFAAKAVAQPRQVSVGDPITLRVAVAGQGSMVEVGAPDLSAVTGFKVYEPSVEFEENVQNGVVGGERTFEYILIPDRGADLEIPSIRFPYFDPEAGEYAVALSEPIQIRVGGAGTEESSAAEYGLSRKDIERVGRDIRHIKPDVVELVNHAHLHASIWFWMMQSLMPLAFVALMLYQRHQRRLGGDIAYARRRRARGDADRRLSRASQLLLENEGIEFFAEIYRALTSFIADRLNIPAASLTNPEQLSEALASRGVDKKTVRTLGEVLEKCEMGRFAAIPSTPAAMQETHEQVAGLLKRLEGLK